MMIKPWLIRIVGKTKQYISLQVLANWIGLLANIVVTASVARLLGALYEGSFEEGQLSATLLAALAAVVVRIVCTLAASRMSFLASDEVKRILRERIYRKLCRLGLSYTEKIGTSEAVQIAGEGVDQLEVYFGSYLPQLFYSLLAPVTLFAVFLPISVKAAVVLLICVPLIPVAIMGVQKLARRLLGQYWGVYADLGGTFLDNVQGLTTLKIYEADGERHKEMNRQAEAFRRITMKVLYMQLNSITVMDVIAYGGAAAGIILSVLEFQAGHISLAGAIMIVLLSADFFIPLRQLGSFFHVAMNGMAASDKMKALFELPEEEERPASFPEQEAEITLSHVDFSYDGSREILKDVSLTIPPKGFVCLVGESGCGKSTIASLLTGVNRGYRGHITAGDTELSDIREESLMSHVTLVNHNAYLFRGTVRDNLRMAAPEADDAALIRALKAANIYEFLEGEKGLDTELAEQGGNLSGGQRQRIALARALLHDTPVYIFDEATSNIDVESEEAIMDTVRALAGRRTILLISHRLANVEAADRIFCMDRGRIAEEGAHTELLEKNGLYASMYRKQKELENYGRDVSAAAGGRRGKTAGTGPDAAETDGGKGGEA